MSRPPARPTVTPQLPALLAAALLAASCAPGGGSGPGEPAAGPYDVLITNGRVVDGTGAPWFFGDVAIAGDRIVRVAPRGVLNGARARTTIDASGRVVAPGFIDIQAQSYEPLLARDGRDVSKITQGITTEVLGEGGTPAPVNERILSSEPRPDTVMDPLREAFTGPHGFGRWLAAMEAHGMSPNVASFLGAATVRAYARGMDRGPASGAELDTMRAVVRRAMEDGALGVGSALIYPPGSYASTEALIAEARAMAPFGGLYITHMRSEGDRLLEAVDEAVRIGREGGVPVEIYHLKAAGRPNWGKEDALLARIDSARRTGLDVQADMYPYAAASTGLTSCLPPWSEADGKLYERLGDEAVRDSIRRDVLTPTDAWEQNCRLATPEGVLLVGFEKPAMQDKWGGKRLSEVAEAMEEPWVDAAMDLIEADSSRVECVFFLMSEENVRKQMRRPWIKFGTDAGAFDPDSAEELTHPRAYGSYPRILGRYVREQGVMTLEEAVRKMTSATAVRLHLRGRGVLRPGAYADVVVFDPATVIDRATYTEPHQLSEGVGDVLVNGVPVVRDGEVTRAKPGRALRGPGWRPSNEGS
ncbi:MAG TPA: D-aminoacylase [Gemmatimonadota bacterium]|nr:D-aminoacylase [Gemmatimonadota bacterium]